MHAREQAQRGTQHMQVKGHITTFTGLLECVLHFPRPGHNHVRAVRKRN
jgi:hypothetical protein